MKISKISLYVLSGIGILVTGLVVYLHFVDDNQVKKPDVKVKIAKTEAAGAATAKVEKVAPTVKPSTRPMVADKKSADKASTNIPEKLAIKTGKEEIPGVSVSPEKPFVPIGVVARSEYCKIVGIPEKIIKKSINCTNGFIDLTEYGLAAIEVNLTVDESDYGEKYFFVSNDEKGKEVEFRYAASIGDMSGLQHGPIVKLFAVGLMKTMEPSYVILECSDALAPELKNNKRTICFVPVIADLKSEESARQALADLFYLNPANLDMLLPQSQVALVILK